MVRPVRVKAARAHKYHATRAEVGGSKFGSKLEARRGGQLQTLAAAGDVAWFIRQPRFDLAPGVQYVADFLIVWRSGAVAVEDCKGVETAMFRTKMRLMAEKWPNVVVTVLTRKDVGRN